jgi:hypothetical protein
MVTNEENKVDLEEGEEMELEELDLQIIARTVKGKKHTIS